MQALSRAPRVTGHLNALSYARESAGLSHVQALRSLLAARRRGFGPLYHSSFRLANTPSDRWADFVTDKEMNLASGRLNGNDTGLQLARDKLAFTRRCLEHGLPTIPVLAAIVESPSENLPDLGDFPLVSDAQSLERHLEAAPARIFLKPGDAAHGDGAFVATREPGRRWSFLGGSGTVAELIETCRRRIPRTNAWMVQPAIVPHPALTGLMASGLGTVRAITWLKNGEVHLVLPVLRIPAGGNVTDNFSLGMSGNLVAPIDLETGVLGTAAGSSSRTWPRPTSVDTHPDTGQSISGLPIPCWAETLDLMRRAQRALPTLPTLGWDIGVTAQGPVIVETNTLYGVLMPQMAYRRGVRTDVADVLESAPPY